MRAHSLGSLDQASVRRRYQHQTISQRIFGSLLAAAETIFSVSSKSLSLTVHDIGVLLDSRLDMSAQVSNVCRAAYSNIFRIAKIRTSLTTAACKTLVHALVTSRLDYGNAVNLLHGISDRLLHRLEMVQRSAARVVLRLRRGDQRSMTAALQQLHWLPVKYRIKYKILVIVFRALHERTPAYIASLITPYVPRRALRSADRALLVVPRHNLERYGRRSFSRAGPTLWNALPEDLRSTVCMNKFKTHLKTYYLKIAFNVYFFYTFYPFIFLFIYLFTLN